MPTTNKVWTLFLAAVTETVCFGDKVTVAVAVFVGSGSGGQLDLVVAISFFLPNLI